MAVQAIAHLAHASGGLPESEIRSWLDAPRSVLRRLGLHALEESADISGPTKLGWVREFVARYPADSAEQREAALLATRLTKPAEVDHGPDRTKAAPIPETLPSLAQLLGMSSRELGRMIRMTRLTASSAFTVLRELNVETRRDGRLAEHELWDLLLERVNWRRLGPAERDELTSLLQPPFPIASRARAVLRCLFHQDPLENAAQDGQPPATPVQAAELFALSKKLWEILRDENSPKTKDMADTDWISMALNDGTGTYHLVRFWLQFVSLQSHDAAHPTLPTDVASIFHDICTRRTEISRRARAVLVQDMRFLMARDSGWTAANMVPLFDFSTAHEEAWVAWRAFLDHGQLSRPLVSALMPHYRASQARFLAAGDELVGKFLQDVASIVVHVRPSDCRDWMHQLLPALSPEDRLRWARLVGRQMEALPDDAQLELWGIWLGDYWRDRRAGRLGTATMPLSGREAAIMVGWLPSLHAIFSEAVELVRQSPIPDFGEEVFPWRELRKSPLPERHPVAFLTLVEFLMTHMDSPRVHHESVVTAVDALPRVAALREPLLRVAETFHQHSWNGARDFRAWVEREFPETGS